MFWFSWKRRKRSPSNVVQRSVLYQNHTHVTLILDEDGIYDPAHFNDRLLLGLRGTMSEGEPVTIASVRYPSIKIHDTRIIRLLEVLLDGGNAIGGWTAKQIHQAVLTTFQISATAYGLNQLRYDLRKLKGHGLLERHDRRYAYHLTAKGLQVALLFLFFHERLCGPLANSRFHHRPDPQHRPDSKLEAAYHKADKVIQDVIDLLTAA